MTHLLSRPFRPLTFVRSKQDYVWIRLLQRQFPSPLCSRISRNQFHLLIRLPLSESLKNPSRYLQQENTGLNHRNLHNNVNLISKLSLEHVRLFLVPNRRFGLGRKDPPFGHANPPARINWVEPLVFWAFALAFLSLFIDWRKLKEKYGIDILPRLLYKGLTQGIDGDGNESYGNIFFKDRNKFE